MEMLGGKDITKNCRKPTIMADAAYAILTRRSTGKFYIDEKLLKELGVTNFDEYAVDKNEPLAPDFFLPEEELKSFPKNEVFELFYGNEQSSQSVPISVESVFNKIKSSLNEELVNKTKGVYAFHITGPENEVWFVDMKNGSGAVGKGQPPAGSADVIFTMELDSFMKMFNGSLKPTAAFMSGKMKLKGDMALAMKLEKLMSAMKSKL
ncbi:hydroxysteroid dehydrogenase-like protein 2 [Trichonephila clavata]|uniref:Hydroxysteroid dehydrogenase-like protein 2 n=1 Tax=Trichonephila clavata TaxID=2740835 RepID=A0A8X6LRX8_TRICU|nr:hydroxysteroid dehydrogenase-like protein 2 [Trichonephila clavata]